MVKFIHTGDVHLGLKFQNASFDKEIALNRRIELWTTFQRIIRYGKENGVDFIFISGDLYESDYFTIGDIRRIRDIFAEFNTIHIVIIAGNHDYIDQSTLYNKVQWSENVTIFNDSKLEMKEFKKKNTTVYGFSWNSREIRDNNVLKDLCIASRTNTNILLLHGDVSKESNYLPLDIDSLSVLDFDYIALGHIHKPRIYSEKIAYCGSPEPLDFGEPGIHGFIEGKIEDKVTNIEFIPFSLRTFYEYKLDINTDMSYQDILNMIKGIELGNKLKDFYRIYIDGFIQEDIDLESLLEEINLEFYHVECINNTKPDYDLEELEKTNKDNIIGLFIKSINMMNVEDKIVNDALLLGLEVLMKDRS